VAEALRFAMQHCRPGEVVVAAGSLTVAGEVLDAWDRVQQDAAVPASEGAS